MILSDALILPVSQLQTQQVMSLIRSHIEYLTDFSYILVEIDENLALTVGFKYDFMMIRD